MPTLISIVISSYFYIFYIGLQNTLLYGLKISTGFNFAKIFYVSLYLPCCDWK